MSSVSTITCDYMHVTCDYMHVACDYMHVTCAYMHVTCGYMRGASFLDISISPLRPLLIAYVLGFANFVISSSFVIVESRAPNNEQIGISTNSVNFNASKYVMARLPNPT